MKNKKPWFMRTDLWEPPLKTGFFAKFWKLGQFSEWEFFYKKEEPGWFSKPAP